MMNKTDLEGLFKNAFESYKAPPPRNGWSNIHYKLWKQQFMKFDFSNFNIYYLSSIILSITTTIFILNFNSNSNQVIYAKTLQSLETSSLNQNISRNANNSALNIDTKTQFTENFFIDKKQESINKLNENTHSNYNSNSIKQHSDSYIENHKQETKTVFSNKKQTIDSSELKNKKSRDEEIISDVLKFAKSNSKGCAPLTVEFINLSSLNSPIEWEFGDGNTSTEQNPVYVYPNPGIFIVTLKCVVNNRVIYKSDTVKVYSTPKALFELECSNKIQTNSIVYFNNKSKNSNLFEWYFGDNCKSNEKMPAHTYKSNGLYDVMLKVWNEHNCYDSVIVSNVKVIDYEHKIIFPTAFKPNISGPTNGYYDNLSVNKKNEVFYPVYRGVKTYELYIYNRYGLLLFQTNNLNIGWDGYYKSELVQEGVYLWKSKGTFDDGTSFEKAGNVTLLHKK